MANVLFITEQGAHIRRTGHSLEIYKDQERIFLFPLEQLSQLVIMGRVEMSTATMGLLMAKGIDTVFLTQDGRFKGRLCGATSKNIHIRERQFHCRQDPAMVLSVSKQIVRAKLKNTSHFLRSARHTLWEALRPRLQNALRSIEACEHLDQLRGIEGSFARLYFESFARLLKHRMGFQRRQKHPPPDPVNILLSLGYTFLFNTLYGLVEAAGLDPFAGFYHQTSYGHPALVSDLTEPFRATVIDRMVVALINNRIITEEDFIKNEDGWRIQDEALKTFARKYQERLMTVRTVGDRRIKLLNIFQQTVWNFQKFIKGEVNRFQPYLFR